MDTKGKGRGRGKGKRRGGRRAFTMQEEGDEDWCEEMDDEQFEWVCRCVDEEDWLPLDVPNYVPSWSEGLTIAQYYEAQLAAEDTEDEEVATGAAAQDGNGLAGGGAAAPDPQ